MKRARGFACLVVIAGAASGAVTNVRVLGTTNTQALLSYTAPDASACSVEVSESAGYSPLVHDVNGAYFPGDQMDSRQGAVGRGRDRTVVIGKRTVERAASGVAYSRALQAATTHYYRISCGADQASGVFQTATIPFGDTHGDPVIPDPARPGLAMQMTPLFARNSTWIDPHTGALIKRMAQPQDNNIFLVFNDNLFTSVLESTNWTNAANALAADGSSATYEGSSCGATCDWLKLSQSISITTSYELRLDVLRISINGSGSDASGANRTVEVCPVTLGATTIDAGGACKDIVLPQTPAKVTSTVSGLVDTWRSPGEREWTLVQIASYGHVRFAVRKKTSTGTISVDAVRIDYWESTTSNVGTGGMLDRCSSVPRTDSDGLRYLCASFNASSAGNLYSIHAESGDVRSLGAIYRIGNFGVTQDNFLWDSADPNRFYGQGSGDTDQFAITYTGAGTEVAAGTKAIFSSTALRAGGEPLGTAVKTFVTAHAAQYPNVPLFDETKFLCPIGAVQGDYLMLDCRRNGQDTIAWLAVYKLSTQAIIAAQPQFAAPSTRWCVMHTRDPLGAATVSITTPTFAKDSYAGNGIYKSTLVGDITATTTNVTVTSSCSGDASCANHVTGEPVTGLGEKYLQAAQAGDVFAIGPEYVRITAKNSPTSWTIARGVDGPGVNTTAASHPSGATFNATCSMKPGSGPTDYVANYVAVWDFLGDPYGMDSTGNYTWGNLYTGHAMARGNLLVGNKSVAQTAEGTSIVASVKDPAYAYNVPEAPWFAGKFPPGPGNAWQQHPSIHQVAAPVSDRQYFWDMRPFVGGNAFTPATPGCNPELPVWPAPNGCAAARVTGFSNVYRMAVSDGTSNPDGLNPKHLALFGVAYTKVLRDVSGPGSALDDTPAKDYTFCYALIADECVPGSSAGNAYVQVPNLTVYYCTGGEGYAGGNDVCLSDYMSTGVSLAQFGFARSKDGIDPAQQSNPNATGAAWTRKMATHSLNLSYRLMSAFTTGKPLANGKWVLATDWVESPLGRGLLALVKVPPAVKDTVNRSTFIPVQVKISPAPRGTDNVIVEFGYAEHGAPGEFRCTSRAEACAAVAAAVNETTPFYWASESFSGLPCASGCTVTLPLYPARVGYYRVMYRDASNQVLLAGPMEVAVAP